MNINRHRRSVHSLYIKILCNELVQEGLVIEDLLNAAHLPQNFMEDGDGMVSLFEFQQFVDFARKRTGKNWLGLSLGAKVVSNHHGPLGYAIASSPDLGTAIEILVKYVSLRTELLALKLKKRRDDILLQLQELENIDSIREVFLEAFTIITIDILQLVFGRQIPDLRLELAYRKPAYVDAYAKHIAYPIEFNCKGNAIILPLEALSTKNIMADGRAFALAEIECQKLIERRYKHQNLKLKIEELVLDPSNPFPALNLVAERICMSKSTLIRKLAHEGTSYKQIINDIRRELASYYLVETAMSVEQVAEKLGFEDTSNFSRVFQRWTNTTPSKFRTSYKAKLN